MFPVLLALSSSAATLLPYRCKDCRYEMLYETAAECKATLSAMSSAAVHSHAVNDPLGPLKAAA